MKGSAMTVGWSLAASAAAQAQFVERTPAAVAACAFAIPDDVALAGVSLFQQFLQLGTTAQGQPTSLSGSNGLALRIGAL